MAGPLYYYTVDYFIKANYLDFVPFNLIRFF